MKLTQEELKKFLHYDPDTGIFTYVREVDSRHPIGSIAGIPQRYGHLCINYRRGTYQLSHLAILYMEGRLPMKGIEVDHINNIPTANWYSNLRECSHMQNCRNSSLRSDSTTGVKGLSINKKANKKFRARIEKWGVQYQKSFYTEKEAIAWLNSIRDELHGEFANRGNI